jgi:hypothetical protein
MKLKIGLKKGFGIGITAIVVIVTVVLIQANVPETIVAAMNNVCMSSDQFESAAKFEIRKPTELPQGYSQQCVKTAEFEAYVVYAQAPLTTTDYREQITKDNAIVIQAVDTTMLETTTPDLPEKRLERTLSNISEELATKMNAKFFQINGYPAWGREAGDYGIETVQFNNGTIISTMTSYEPARLRVNIGNVDYVLESNGPLIDLIKVAESLK